jgi:hypothetical protein
MMRSFLQLEDVVRYLLAEADWPSGLCGVPVCVAPDLEEMVKDVNDSSPGQRCLQIEDPCTVRITDVAALQEKLSILEAWGLVEELGPA